jgi:GntR family transcriptional regulator
MSQLLSSLKSEWQLSQHGAMTRVPLYHQLYIVLKKAILDGTIPYDAQMPTEQQLAATFDVSRITAKRAMDELAAEKLVARFRGKGSHVTYHYQPEPVSAPLVGMLKGPVEIAKHGSVRVITTERAVPPADVRRTLDLDDEAVVHKVLGCTARLGPLAARRSEGGRSPHVGDRRVLSAAGLQCDLLRLGARRGRR